VRCAGASGSKYAAAAVLGQQDGMFESSVVLFRTDAEEIACTIPIGNAMIYDLHFVSDSKLCVLAEDALSFYDLDGNLLGSFSYGESYLKDYTTDGSGCLTLVMNLYQAGNRYTVLTVGYDGAELGRLSSGEQILDISAAGKYLAILTSSSLSIYDQALQEYDVSDNTAGAGTGGGCRVGPGGGYLPPTRLRRRSVKKCYRHLKFRAVIPARCPGSAGANFTDNGLRKILEIFHSPVPARCLTDIRISTDEGAITQAQSDPKRGITPCPSSGRLYVRRIPADPVTFFCEQAGITLQRDSVFMILLLMC